MNSLELKIPPGALVLLAALGMLLVSSTTPSLGFQLPYNQGVAIAFLIFGVAVSLLGVVSFRIAKTTVNPTKPQATSTLVSTGIYRFSRNPMYLGFLFALVGLAALLSNVLASLFVPAFMIYMNRFQIAPEERVLTEIFGSDFQSYKERVRRWA